MNGMLVSCMHACFDLVYGPGPVLLTSGWGFVCAVGGMGMGI